jgi:hypothetical protein
MGPADGNSPLRPDSEWDFQAAGRAAIPVEGGVAGDASWAGGAS